MAELQVVCSVGCPFSAAPGSTVVRVPRAHRCAARVPHAHPGRRWAAALGLLARLGAAALAAAGRAVAVLAAVLAAEAAALAAAEREAVAVEESFNGESA